MNCLCECHPKSTYCSVCEWMHTSIKERDDFVKKMFEQARREERESFADRLTELLEAHADASEVPIEVRAYADIRDQVDALRNRNKGE